MKKFVIGLCAALALAVTLLVGCYPSDWQKGFTSNAAYPEQIQNGYYSMTEFSSVLNIDLADYKYFIYYGYNNGEYISYLIYYSPVGFSGSWNSDNSLYTVNYTGNYGVGVSWTYYANANSMTQFNGSTYPKITISNTINIIYYDSQDNISGGTGTWTNYGYVTNFDGFETQGSLEFSITPNLTGSITRSGQDNGQYYTLDTFAVTVDNYSHGAYMYSWAIVPHGVNYSPYYSSIEQVDYIKAVDEKRFYSVAPTYIYFSDEWVYIPAAGNSFSEVLTPSSWHYIAAGGHIDNFVQFNQMNLIANTEYDILCFGIPLTGQRATYLDKYWYTNNLCAVDFINDTELFYSSTFSITDPATFDRNSRGFGSYAWNDSQLYHNAEWTMRTYGYKDENGNTVIQENDMTDFNLSAHPVNGFNYNSGNRDNFDRLTDTTDTFFTACNRVLSMFPADCLLIIQLGLAALVVVALFRGLSK